MCDSFKVKSLKVKVTRPIIAENESVSYLRNGKAYELQNGYADGACYQLPCPAIKVYEVGFLHADGDVPCQPNRRTHHLLITCAHYADRGKLLTQVKVGL